MVRTFTKQDVGRFVSLVLEPKKYGLFEENLEEKATALFVAGTITKVMKDHMFIYIGKDTASPDLISLKTIEVPYAAIQKARFPYHKNEE